MPASRNTVMRTQRLALISVSPDLAPAVAAFYQRNQRHLAPWDPPSPADFLTETFQQQRLTRLAGDVAAGAALRWWIQPLDDPTLLIGSVSLTQVARGPFQNAMLGYAVDAAFEGKGYMREALEAAISRAFSPRIHLHRIQANVRPENTRSLALLQRLGFEQEGLAREYLFIDGAWRDHTLWALRNSQFAGVPK